MQSKQTVICDSGQSSKDTHFFKSTNCNEHKNHTIVKGAWSLVSTGSSPDMLLTKQHQGFHSIKPSETIYCLLFVQAGQSSFGDGQWYFLKNLNFFEKGSPRALISFDQVLLSKMAFHNGQVWGIISVCIAWSFKLVSLLKNDP